MKIENLLVVKIGGSTLGQHDTTMTDLVELQKRGVPLVVIHGGGKIITEWLTKLGVPTKFVQGERVTDQSGLEVVTAVLAGLVNKDLVATLNAGGGRAVGLSGADGALLEGQIKNPDLGYVGQPVKVNNDLLITLIKAGYIPLISSISLNMDRQAGTGPLLLNVNADAAAGEIAASLGAQKLIFLTDIAGILDANGKVISKMNARQAEALTAAGTASGGMIPKIRAGIRALAAVEITRIIDGRQPHALLNEIERAEGGTSLVRQ
jgi:acetylglutamate kinase